SGVAFIRTGKGAAGQTADTHHANAGGSSMVEQPGIVLSRTICRYRSGSRWIEHVVDNLGTVEDACIDYLMQRRGIADRGDPQETRLPLVAQFLKGGHHVI